MSNINCPQCGRVISDTIRKCPKCRFPVGKFTDKKTISQDENSFVMDEHQFDLLRSEIADSVPKHHKMSERNKKIVYVVISVVLILVFGIGILLYSVDAINSKYEKPVLNVTTLSASRMMKLNGEYIVYIKSDETKPFVAVYYDRETKNNHYVIMSGGKGSLHFLEHELFIPDVNETDKIRTERFELKGYINGFSLSEKDVEGSNNVKYSYSGRFSGAEITLKNKMTGILFYSVQDQNGITIIDNCCSQVFHGTAKLKQPNTVALYHGTVSIKPDFFLPADIIEKNEYSVDGFDIEYSRFYAEDILSRKLPEKNNSQYYESNKIFGTINMNNSKDGVLLYEYDIKGNDEISGFGMSFSEKGKFNIVTDDIYLTKEENKKNPAFSITICGFVPIISPP